MTAPGDGSDGGDGGGGGPSDGPSSGGLTVAAPVPEAHLRLLIESVRDYAIFMLDPEGRVATWNEGAHAIKGYTAGEIIGRHISTFYTEADRARHRAETLLAAALADGRVEDEGWRVRKDGTRFWADVVITALRDASGALVGFAKVTRDLTERRAAEDRLRQADEMLTATLYSIGDGVLATDEQGRVILINRVAERLTGWAEGEAVGRPVDEVFDIVNEETRAPALNPVTRVLREGIVVGLANHTALIARDGSERPIADSGAPIRDADGQTRGAVLVFRDVTHERRAEEALRESEERLRLMIASIRDYAVFMLDTEGRITTWNPGAEQIHGYREDEIVGLHFSRFFTEEDLAAGKPARELAEAAATGRFEDEACRVRKDGTRFWANVVLSAVHDGAGQLVGFTKVTRDLTERRRIEDERVRLAQADEAVRLRDEFLSIASHELRTPLTALQLQLDALLDDPRAPLTGELARKVGRAARAGRRLGDLIETLLDVSRIATGRLALAFESFDLAACAREVTERLGEASARAGCTVTLDAPAPVVGRWDRLRIEQILTNLLANAIKYAAGSAITVRVAVDGEQALLEVADTGGGLRERDLVRIFDRFERASTPARGGLGLGLYIAQQVAQAHGGSIHARNLPTGGASFVVCLPRPASSPG
ncbi:MAG TPA: PAS domain S-box protein [Kofleriaceae bacterium]|nr:PAS domain S-box protein [Kofleriaceae bacterium]